MTTPIRRAVLPVAIVSVLALAGVAAIRFWPKPEPPSVARVDLLEESYAGPYLNVRPDAKYIGDAACAECHKEIAATFAKHPMGRSLAPLTAASSADDYSAAVKNPFSKFGHRYRVERRADKVFHHEEQLDERGGLLASNTAEAAYVLGSGTRGKSYLVQRGNTLYQSPISWFNEERIWDISPGYNDELHFNRPIDARCLFCHANRAETVAGAINGFREPIFHGHAIGCERCHGPGERHVQRRKNNEAFSGRDYSVVNPRDLTPALRDAVCEQCHLQGEVRVLRRGREPFDYRPGLPLESFWSIFVRVPELNPGARSVGQVEQLQQSRCWTATQGKLGCISCHDPHERPAETKRVEHYRARCLECHRDHGCKLEAAVRKKRQPDDSCIACHMTKTGSANIPHTAVTDHRISRRPEPRSQTAPRGLTPGELPIYAFHRDRPALDADELERDLGLALVELQRRMPKVPPQLVQAAMPLVERAANRRADDVDSWTAYGAQLQQTGRPAEALAAYEKALAIAPRAELTLVDAAQAAAALDRPQAAIAFWRRALDVNPWLPAYHLELARLLAQQREWSSVRTSCEKLLRIEPLHTDARILYVTSLIRTGARDLATQEFQTLLKLRPQDAADLQRWFKNQTQ